MRESRHTLSFVIPFLNEANNLPRLLEAVDNFARTVAPRHGLRVDTIFVDDGSTDGSREILTACARARTLSMDIRIIRLSRNFGKEVALSIGLQAAATDAVVFMDADMQHPIALVERFVDGWLTDGYDVVYGYREDVAGETWAKRIGRKLYYRAINVDSDARIPPNAGDFRLLTRRAYEALRQLPERQRFMKGLYSWIGFKQKGIPFIPSARLSGASRFSPVKLALLALDGITSFSIFPLRLATWVGLVLALISGGYGLYTIFEKLFLGTAVPGYPTVMTAIAFIGAAQLIFLGVIGEYLGKVLVEVKARPLAIVESDEDIKIGAVAPAIRLASSSHLEPQW